MELTTPPALLHSFPDNGDGPAGLLKGWLMQEGAQQGPVTPWEAARLGSVPWLLSLISQAAFRMT